MEDMQLSQCKEKFKSLHKTKIQTNMDNQNPAKIYEFSFLALREETSREKSIRVFIQVNNFLIIKWYKMLEYKQV